MTSYRLWKMKKYMVEYEQREVRTCFIEAENDDEAIRKIQDLRDRDNLPSGEFSSASEQEVLFIDCVDDDDSRNVCQGLPD